MRLSTAPPMLLSALALALALLACDTPDGGAHAVAGDCDDEAPCLECIEACIGEVMPTPLGLRSPPTVTRHDNVRAGLLFHIGPPAHTKAALFATRPLTAGDAGSRDLTRTAGVNGGQHVVVSAIPDGFLTGSTGAGPCVILGLLVPGCSGPTARFYHFTAGDDPYRTLQALGALPAGTRAAVAGGDNSTVSNRTLSSVKSWLDAQANVQVDGYLDRVGLWVDRDGGWHHHRVDMVSQNQP